MTLFNQTDFMKTLEQLKDIVELSAITRDSRGSVIVKNRIKIFVEAEKSMRLLIRREPGIYMRPVSVRDVQRTKPGNVCHYRQHCRIGDYRALRCKAGSFPARICPQ